MYTAELRFEKKDGRLTEADVDRIDDLLSRYYLNGQIWNSGPWVIDGGMAIVHAEIPERNSLSSRFATMWVERAQRELKVGGIAQKPLKIYGRSVKRPQAMHIQKCSWLILYYDFVYADPPLRCGETFKMVPVYHTPPLDETLRHDEIFSWQDVYRACQELFVRSGVGEKYGYRQISRHDSELSKEGRELCRSIENATGLPTYYHLDVYYGRSLAQERKRRCPSCEGQWLLKEPLHQFIAFKCDKCRLVSNIAYDV